jgi:hypothetical protein
MGLKLWFKNLMGNYAKYNSTTEALELYSIQCCLRGRAALHRGFLPADFEESTLIDPFTNNIFRRRVCLNPFGFCKDTKEWLFGSIVLTGYHINNIYNTNLKSDIDIDTVLSAHGATKRLMEGSLVHISEYLKD